jgi:hypothetical protein
MVQASSQKNVSIQDSTFIFLIAKFGYIDLWMTTTPSTSQN